MSGIAVLFAIIDIVSALAMIILFLVQEGNDRGMGVVAGASTDSYYSKAKGRSLEERLKFYTKVAVIIFSASSILLYLAIAHAW
jgi:preprotein translocase subunit SecG